MSDDETRLLTARLLAASPFAMTMEDALAHIRARRVALLAESPPASAKAEDFATAEPMPVIDAPEEFAADFWRGRKLPTSDDEPPKPKPKATRPKGRRPTELGPKHSRFEVFDGGEGADVDKQR